MIIIVMFLLQSNWPDWSDDWPNSPPNTIMTSSQHLADYYPVLTPPVSSQWGGELEGWPEDRGDSGGPDLLAAEHSAALLCCLSPSDTQNINMRIGRNEYIDFNPR